MKKKDKKLQKRAERELRSTPDINLTEISSSARDNVNLARETSGVLTKTENKPVVSDDGLEFLIEQAFRWELKRNEDRLQVTARNGLVKLWGSVPTWDEGYEAEQTIRAIPGVIRVENHLKVKN
jgi:osmotically-inducible protein OsmY